MQLLLSLGAEHHQMAAQDVVAAHDEIGSEIALVPVEKTGSGGDVGADSGLPAGVEALQFEVGGHEEVDELGVCSSACPARVDVGSDIVNLLAVLFDDDGSSSCPRIGSQHHSFCELDADDSSSSLFVRQRLDGLLFLEKLVSNSADPYLWVRVKSNPPIWSA
jgi:hypothetical protein